CGADTWRRRRRRDRDDTASSLLETNESWCDDAVADACYPGAHRWKRAELQQGASSGFDRSRQHRLPVEIPVDTCSAGPTLGDRPHDEALAAAHVTAREHPRHAGHERAITRDVAAFVEIDAE